MTQTKEQSVLGQITADFAVYLNPDLLKDGYTEIISQILFDKEKIEEYLQLLADIEYASQKTLRYEVYFAEFYSSSEGIEEFEALNHHIHAYLEDMTILSNKIEVFLNTLKNDIKKKADNKSEVEEFFKAGVEKTKEVFQNISKYRNPHHHKGMRFLDGDLLKAENASRTIEMFEKPPFSEMLNPERKPELIEKLNNEKKEGFKAAKIRWIEIAKNNAQQTREYLDELMSAIRPPMYDFLEITSPTDLLK